MTTQDHIDAATSITLNLIEEAKEAIDRGNIEIENYTKKIDEQTHKVKENEIKLQLLQKILQAYTPTDIDNGNKSNEKITLTPRAQKISSIYYDDVYNLIKENGGTMRSSDIAESIGKEDRKIELKVHSAIGKLERDKKIKRVSEVTDTGEPRRRNLLYTTNII